MKTRIVVGWRSTKHQTLNVHNLANRAGWGECEVGVLDAAREPAAQLRADWACQSRLFALGLFNTKGRTPGVMLRLGPSTADHNEDLKRRRDGQRRQFQRPISHPLPSRMSRVLFNPPYLPSTVQSRLDPKQRNPSTPNGLCDRPLSEMRPSTTNRRRLPSDGSVYGRGR